MTPLDIVIVGLSLSSSWGNGHATTYRALLAGLAAEGHRVLFLERDVPWYAENRDLPDPDFCRLALYDGLDDLDRFRGAIAATDVVVVGSYVPEGPAVIDRVKGWTRGLFCFYDIDTPVTLAALARGDEEFLARRQMPGFDLYFSFSGGRALDRLQDEFAVRRPRALYCSVDPDRYRPTGEAPVWDLGYLGTYSPDRQPTLEALLIEPARRRPQMRFVVAGSRYPDSIAWPANVERIEHLPPSAHASFYARQRFTLNVTRADMIACGHSPSVRLFEAGACGTPVVSDRWDGLGELLPEGEALLTAARPEEMIEILDTVPETRRRDIGEKARARILAAHTGRARAREFAAAVAAARREAPYGAVLAGA